jgi:tape measure domain-containing protein
MTTESITIAVDQKGARVVKRDIENIGKGGKNAQSDVGRLNNVLRSLGVTLSLGLITSYADEYTNLQNRLKLVTRDTHELNSVTRELFRVANSTRSSFSTTTEVYARTALATRGLGLSQRETLQFTKSLNQAVILSGASFQEAHAGMIQLSQGLASGTLRGDELRSVMEQLPLVADVIADGMEATRDELRQLGTDGVISAEKVIDAFKKASDELQNNFNNTVPTVGQSFVVLKNRALEFLGELDKTSGAAKAVSENIIKLSENLVPIAQILTTLTGLWALYRVQLLLATGAQVLASVTGSVVAFVSLAGTVRSAAGAVTLLNTAFLFGPGSLFFVLAAIGAAIFVFRDDIKLGLTGIVAEAIIFIDDLVFGLQQLKNILDDGVVDPIQSFTRNIAASLGFISKETAESLNSKDALDGDARGPIETLSGFTREELRQAVDDVGDDILKNRKDFSDYFDFQLPSLNDSLPTFDSVDFLAGYDSEATKVAKAIELSKEMKAILQRQKDLLEDIIGPQEKYTTSISDLNVLYEQGLISLQQYHQQLGVIETEFLKDIVPTDFAEGFINQLKIMQNETSNTVGQMGAEFAQIFGPSGSLNKGIGDATARAIVFGDSFAQSIRQVAQAVLTQLISSFVQMGVTMLLNSLLGKTILASTTAASVAAGATVASAWAPAAAAVSLASFGTNAIGAAAGVTSTFALTQGLASVSGSIPGFKDGGYTGNGGVSDVAGVVHGKEFVMTAEATKNNRPMLEAMNKGKKPSNSSSNVNIKIVNEIPDAQFETRQINENDVEIIARRVVREDAPSVIATDINNPNSRTSKALSKNTSTQRRRK